MSASVAGGSIRSVKGCVAFALLAGALFAPYAHAQSADVRDCAQKKGDEAIDACTRAINAGPKNKALAEVYFNRGIEWNAKKERDKAIADYTEALHLNPQYREAYNNRGNAYRAKR